MRESKFFQKNKKIAGIVVSVLVLVTVFYYFVGRPIFALYKDAQNLFPHLQSLKEGIGEQNLKKLEKETGESLLLLKKTRNDFSSFSWMRLLPFLKNYFLTGNHLINGAIYSLEAAEIGIEDLKPFSEFLGFAETSEEASLSTKDKLQQIAMIGPQLTPSLKEIEEKLELASKELVEVNPKLFPENFRGIKIREELNNLSNLLPQVKDVLEDLEPVLNKLPEILGTSTPQTYLVLFQNDKELRPTGGFITAYALIQFDQGIFSIIKSEDIYKLDSSAAYLPTPEPIAKYLKLSGWFMRDTNFSPDFKKSMEDFEYYFARSNTLPIGGIMAIDTQFVASLLEITGPILIKEYSLDFSGSPNLPESCRQGGQEFTSENIVCRLELYAQRISAGSTERKAILGDLMEVFVDRTLSAPKDKWRFLLQNLLKQAEEKHFLCYFHDSTLQSLAEKYNFAGHIQDFKGDYLHINDANLAGLKSDMYMKKSISYKITIADDGTVRAQLVITYHNTGKYDGWLNSTARNYVRVYVPQGSQLLSWKGGEEEPEVFDDLGKTVFDNFVLTKPLSQSRVEFEYQLPFKVEREKSFSLTDYDLLIQKQPGLEAPHYTVEMNGQKQEFDLKTDKKLTFKL